MRLLRRILITLVVVVAVIFGGLYGVAPVALSYYEARKAIPITKIVPTELEDRSVSDAPTTKLSYLGFEFEVPWSDVDETQTKLYPSGKPQKVRADLRFHSGLRLAVSVGPPRTFETQVANDIHTSPQVFEALFGKSDYSFLKTVYGFSPERIRHWPPSSARSSRDMVLLMLKSILPSKPAESGIFLIQNANYKGFQQGNPKMEHDGIILSLYSDEGGIEFVFSLKNYKGQGISQPELNRIIQSLRKSS
jgi:hypothetical protein